MDGLENAARFAIQPNMWGFCGEDASQVILRNLVSEKELDYDLVRETLCNHGFPHLNAFLRAISQTSGLDMFDEHVVESYWLGEDLTEIAADNAGEALVDQYEKQLPGGFAKGLEKQLPEKLYLTHLSQVILIAAADYENAEKENRINNCMVAYGKVIALDTNNAKASVEREIINVKNDGKYEVNSRKQEVRIDPDLTHGLNIGNDIAVHLGYLAAKLTQNQSERLRFWTRKVAESI